MCVYSVIKNDSDFMNIIEFVLVKVGEDFPDFQMITLIIVVLLLLICSMN